MGEFPSKANQFQPGNKANPKGRPKGRTVSAELRRLVESEAGAGGATGATRIAERLMQIAEDDGLLITNPKVVVAAIKEVIDRTEGRAKQTVDLSVKELPPVPLSTLSPDDLRGLRDIANKLARSRAGSGRAGD